MVAGDVMSGDWWPMASGAWKCGNHQKRAVIGAKNRVGQS